MLDKIRTDKKGVSELIGYVLLVVFAVIIGAIIFTWLRTYVPADSLSCPDSVSVFVSEAIFDNSTSELNLTIRNNGRFDIAGYFIHATNNSSQEVETIDLSPYLNENFSGRIFGNSVVFGQSQNVSFGPNGNFLQTGDKRTNVFNIPGAIGEPYSLRIIPTRFQEENNRQRFVSCNDAKVKQLAGAPYVCIPDCTGKACGSDGCGGSCGNCSSGFFCDALGQCISTSCTPVSNPCGTFVCGTAANGTCGQVSCGTCTGNATCNQATGQCVSLCGNGIIDSGEQCDDGNTNNSDGCSSSCTIESGWTCSGQPSSCQFGGVSSCPNYCVSLNYGTGSCTSSAGTCQAGGGVYESGGDQWCTGGSQADTCCCTPTQIQLAYFGFESGSQSWADPGSDSDRSNARSKVLDSGANGGTFSWHIQDNSGSSYTEQNFDFSGFSQVRLEWWGYYHHYESNEPDCIELKIDGVKAESWGTSFCNNNIFQTQDTWLSQSATISSSQFTFDSSVTVRFESKADAGADDFYFDGLNITGIS